MAENSLEFLEAQLKNTTTQGKRRITNPETANFDIINFVAHEAVESSLPFEN
jgi:hypothetical protein